MRHDRPTDTKTLSTLLGLTGKPSLRFADAETLSSVLGVTQGAVSPLAVVNDTEVVATFAIDKALFDASDVLVHPLRNDRSVSLKPTDLLKVSRVSFQLESSGFCTLRRPFSIEFL